MRNPDRIEKVLSELKSVWEENPELRLGQLIFNVISDDGLGEEKVQSSYSKRVQNILNFESLLYEYEKKDWLRAFKKFREIK